MSETEQIESVKEVELYERITREQAADLKKYVPESPTVRMVFEDMININIKDWDEAVEKMVLSSLDGDPDALFDLLELTLLNGHNEGLIEAMDAGA